MSSEPGSNTPKGSGDGTGGGVAAPLTIHSQYIKDLSFESPAAPGVFQRLQAQNTNIQVNVNVQAHGIAEKTYEVVLTITSECKTGDLTAFVLELSYGGVFGVNVGNDMLQPVLLIECPRLLFPFARHIIATATRDGGFPPLMLGPVDFVALYQRMITESQAKTGGQQTPPEASSIV